VDHGDSKSEVYLTEIYGLPGIPQRDLIAEADYDYGARVGVWRILDLFEKHSLPLTVFVSFFGLLLYTLMEEGGGHGVGEESTSRSRFRRRQP
jgi:hypothetical protein